MRKLLFLFAMLAGPLAAQDIDCTDAQNQREMNFCAAQSYQYADEDLNLAYKLAIAQHRGRRHLGAWWHDGTVDLLQLP